MGVDVEADWEEGRGFGAGGGAKEKEGEKEKDASRVIWRKLGWRESKRDVVEGEGAAKVRRKKGKTRRVGKGEDDQRSGDRV